MAIRSSLFLLCIVVASACTGDFVSRFAGIAKEEAKVAKAVEKIDTFRAAGQTKAAEGCAAAP